jgi:trimethylamine:corrinoid methyltransferase-like protein
MTTTRISNADYAPNYGSPFVRDLDNRRRAGRSMTRNLAG